DLRAACRGLARGAPRVRAARRHAPPHARGFRRGARRSGRHRSVGGAGAARRRPRAPRLSARRRRGPRVTRRPAASILRPRPDGAYTDTEQKLLLTRLGVLRLARLAAWGGSGESASPLQDALGIGTPPPRARDRS